jgi:hypothetical protein
MTQFVEAMGQDDAWIYFNPLQVGRVEEQGKDTALVYMTNGLWVRVKENAKDLALALERGLNE